MGFGLLARQLCFSLPAPKNQAQGARGHPQGSGGAGSRCPPRMVPLWGHLGGLKGRGSWQEHPVGALHTVCVCVCNAATGLCTHAAAVPCLCTCTPPPRSDAVLVHAHVYALQRCCACDAHTHTPCSHAVLVVHPLQPRCACVCMQAACSEGCARARTPQHRAGPVCAQTLRSHAVLVHSQAPCRAAVRVCACKHLAVTLCLCVHTQTPRSDAVLACTNT